MLERIKSRLAAARFRKFLVGKNDSARSTRNKKNLKTRSFHLQKIPKSEKPNYASAPRIIKTVWSRILKDKERIAWFWGSSTFVYLLAVRGFGDRLNIQDTIDQARQLGLDNLRTSVTAVEEILASAGSTLGEAANVYQMLFLIIFTMASMWMARQLYSRQKEYRVRDAFYGGTSQFIVFVLVFITLLASLIPLILGNMVSSVLADQGLSLNLMEQTFVFVFVALTWILSFYWLVATGLGLVVASIPGSYPVASIRTGAGIAKHRRLGIVRRLIIIVAFCVSLVSILMLVVTLVLPSVAETAFFAVAIFALFFYNLCFFEMYRELIRTKSDGK